MGCHNLMLFMHLKTRSCNSRPLIQNNSLQRKNASYSFGGGSCGVAWFFVYQRFDSVNRSAAISCHFHAPCHPLSALSKGAFLSSLTVTACRVGPFDILFRWILRHTFFGPKPRAAFPSPGKGEGGGCGENAESMQRRSFASSRGIKGGIYRRQSSRFGSDVCIRGS